MIRTEHQDALLRAADPEHRQDQTSDAAQLQAVRNLVDQRRTATRPAAAVDRRPVPGRRTALVVGAVAAVTAAPVVLSLSLPGDSEPQRLLPAAVAADGSLQCGGNAAGGRKVPLAESDARYLPGWLPPGWALTGIWANEVTWVQWCVQPSLVVLQLSEQGLVTGKLSVTGPIEATVDAKSMGATVPDVVDGHPARRFTGDAGLHLQTWLWTDDAGRQWLAEAIGFPVQDAGRLLAPVSTAAEQIRWDGAKAAPGFKLVHLRTGDPYSTTSRILDWNITLNDGTRERELEVTRRHGDAIPVAARADVGARLITIGGHPAVLQPATGNHEGEPDVGDDIKESQTPVVVEVAPGIVAQGRALGDLGAVERLLASMASVPVDDPRLSRYDGPPGS